MKRAFWIGLLLGCAMVLILMSGIATAQDDKPKAPQEAQVMLGGGFTYQGQLTSGGAPVDNVCDFQFSLWNAASSGTQIGSTQTLSSVNVSNGFFTVLLNGANQFSVSPFTGDARWLRIAVRCPAGSGAYTTLAPRQALTAAPYALGLRPGAIISGTAGNALNVVNNQSSGNGIFGHAVVGTNGWGVVGEGSGVGVYGYSPSDNGKGILGISGNYVGGEAPAGVVGTSATRSGVIGYSNGPTVPAVAGFHGGDGPAIYGSGGGVYPSVEGLRSDNGIAVGGYAQGGIGVQGQASTGNAFYGYSSGQGRFQATLRVFNIQSVQGMAAYITNTSGFATAHFANGGSGEVLYLQNGGAAGSNSNGAGGGDFISARNSNEADIQFRVATDGTAYSDTSFNGGGADFAEMLPAVKGLEVGDVLVVNLDGKLERSTQAYQPTVVGVYSSQPGFVGGSGPNANLSGRIPLAIVGIVPVKVSAENGAIQPGDLLVASSTRGHAMKAASDPPQGTVIGKAFGTLKSGTGVIQMLVILQ